jgi:hypothetical protein
MNPVYQQLRTQLAEVRRQGAASASRLATAQALLREELERSRKILGDEGTVTALTRAQGGKMYEDLSSARTRVPMSWMRMGAVHRSSPLRSLLPADCADHSPRPACYWRYLCRASCRCWSSTIRACARPQIERDADSVLDHSLHLTHSIEPCQAVQAKLDRWATVPLVGVFHWRRMSYENLNQAVNAWPR